MSHYRVAVFSYSPSDVSFDELLAPYDENLETEFVPISDEDNEYYKDIYEKNNYPGTFEEFLTDQGFVNDEESGELGYWHNPQAKWDWYSLDGGDWQFDLKKGEELDEYGNGRKNQFDYVERDFSKEKCSKRWKDLKQIAESTINDAVDENNPDVRMAKFFIKDYPDLEGYLRVMKSNHPYAFITPDGEWHSPGRVGWFATSDETPESYQNYLDEWEAWIASDENPYVRFVDCHI